jgi:hypothetical protein
VERCLPAAAHARQHKGAGVGRPLTERARVLARRKDVPSLQTYSDHSTDKHSRLREQRIAGTRSLPALGPARAARPREGSAPLLKQTGDFLDGKAGHHRFFALHGCIDDFAFFLLQIQDLFFDRAASDQLV